MKHPLYNPLAVAPFEEDVTCEYALQRDAAGTVRRFPLRAAVVYGRNGAGGAGAPSAPETGDRLSVAVRFEAWPLEEEPGPGVRFVFGGPRGTYVCKAVTSGPTGWTLRCTRNMRGEEL